MSKIIKILLFLFIPAGLFGQLTPVTDQYVLNPLSINPAYAGNRGALNIAAFYRRQWVGISGAPVTASLILDAPFLDSKLGLGLMVINDKIGVTKQTRISSIYAFRIKMRDGNLALGLGAGIITTNTIWSDLTVNDPGDEDFLISSRILVAPDFNFGVYYSKRNYFAGVSIPKLIDNNFDFNKNRYTLKLDPGQYNYLFNTGYLFTLSPKVGFLPSTLLSFSPGEKLLYDLNAYLIIVNRIWVGASYRNERSVACLLQLAVSNKIRVAYTYDFDFGKLGRFSNGSHEVMVRYEFHFKVNVVNPLIF
jgi:type IX secretion system PorP/SprF family membrane protein